MKLGKAIPYDILIQPSANMGFVTRIGCGTFVSKTKIDLIGDLESYLSDPAKWENEYSKTMGPQEIPTTRGGGGGGSYGAGRAGSFGPTPNPQP